VLLLAAAQRAAPSRPALSLVMTCTEMLSRSGRSLPFSRKARMKSGPVSRGRIFGEIPPPRKIPPVAIAFRARLPASAPYTEIHRSSASSANRFVPLNAAWEIAAAASPLLRCAANPAGSSATLFQQKFIHIHQTRTGQDSFVTDVPVSLRQKSQQFDLQFPLRREVHVSPFAGKDFVTGLPFQNNPASPSPVPGAITA
jgi:hypothetical protein